MAIDHRLSPPPALVPQAAPVDTYVRPPTPARRTDLYQLADALQGLSAELDGMMSGRKEDQKATDAAAGAAEFWRNNLTGAGKAVADGSVPAHKSPAFMRAYSESQADLLGTTIAERFGVAYNTWEGRTSGDAVAFDKFFTDFMKENVPQGLDDFAMRKLGPQMSNVHAAYSQKFLNDSSDAAKAGFYATTQANMSKAVEAGVVAGAAAGSVDIDTLWTSIGAMRKTSVDAGEDPEKIDRGAIDTIINKAIEFNEPKLLTLLDQEIPGEGRTYAQTAYGGQRKNETVARFDVLVRQQQEQIDKARNQAEKEAKDKFEAQAQEQLAGNPAKVLDETFLREWSKVDPTARTKAVDWQKTLLSADRAENPDDILSVQREIMEGGGREVVSRALSNGIIRDPSTLTSLNTFAKSFEEGKTIGDRMLQSDAANNYIAAIKDQTQGASRGLYPGGWSPGGLKAATDFRTQVYVWASQHPDADFVTQQKAMEEIYQGIYGNVKNPFGASGNPFAPSYARPGEAPAAPQSGVAVPGATPLAAPGAPSPASPQAPPQTLLQSIPFPGGTGIGEIVNGIQMFLQGNPWPAQLPTQQDETGYATWWSSLTPEQQTSVNAAAVNSGKDPEGFKRRAYLLFLQNTQGGGAPASPPVPVPESAVPPVAPPDQSGAAESIPTATPVSLRIGEIIDQAMAHPAVQSAVDGDVRPLLNLIGGAEAPAGYNQLYGERTPQHDLASLTVDQVLTLQRERVRAGSASSAAGRYQFLSKTLAGLKDSLGLTGSELFTPELQDRLAVALMKQRGLDDFLAGNMEPADFANNLAQEWAGLPLVSGSKAGRSYYHGKLNRATTTPGKVAEALAAIGVEGPAPDTLDSPAGASGPGNIYANIPDADEGGNAGQLQKFLQWNPDPVGNSDKVLGTVAPDLQTVIRAAQQAAAARGIRFVVASGRRSVAQQEDAVSFGWSKTARNSDHLDGTAADLWILDKNGAVTFSPKAYGSLARIMKETAASLGVKLKWGGDFKAKTPFGTPFVDRPHFSLVTKEAA